MHFYAFCTAFWSLQQIHNLWIYHKYVCSPQICIESEAGMMSWVYHNGTLLSLQPDAKIHPSFPKISYVSAAPCLILHIQKFHCGLGWDRSCPQMQPLKSNHLPHFSCKAVLYLRGWHSRKFLSCKWKRTLDAKESGCCLSLLLFALVSLRRASIFSLQHKGEKDA